MLTEILHWWARQMLDLLPASIGAGGARVPDGWRVRADGPDGPDAHISLIREVGRVRTPEGHFTLDAEGIASLRATMARTGSKGALPAVQLELPAHLMLERDTTLPLAAEAELERVLRYEMDRITPFPAEDLFWTWRILRRERAFDQAGGRLHVRLSLVPKTSIARLLADLSAAGLEVAALSADPGDGAPRRIPLVRRSGPRPWLRLTRRLAALCAVLTLALVATPFLRDLQTIATAEARIAALGPRTALAEVLRQRITKQESGRDVFAAEIARIGSPLQALAALTDVLPDDTWLSGYTQRQRVITFSGQSARAARLIAALSADPALGAPTFVTPVTRAGSSGMDLFSIRTELGP